MRDGCRRSAAVQHPSTLAKGEGLQYLDHDDLEAEVQLLRLWGAGVIVPTVRELRTTRYQWDRPFIRNSAITEDALGLKLEPLDDALREAAQSARR